VFSARQLDGAIIGSHYNRYRIQRAPYHLVRFLHVSK